MKAFYNREMRSLASKISKKIKGGKVERETIKMDWLRPAEQPDGVRIGSHAFDVPKDPAAVDSLRLYMPADRAPTDARPPSLMMERGEGKQFMPAAFHGTPHTFKAEEGAPLGRFRSEQIGTGEGAQAYGHGLYFAGKKQVAEHYRKNLSENRYFKADGTPFEVRDNLKNINVRATFWNTEGNIDATIQRTRDLEKSIPDTMGAEQARADRKVLEKLKKEGGLKAKAGSLYKVELAPKENEYLLWDKPLSEQHKGVREKLEIGDVGLISEYEALRSAKYPSGRKVSKSWTTDKQIKLDELRARMDKENQKSLDGRTFYTNMADRLGGPAASAALLEAGIPGIKYLEGASRNVSTLHITPPSRTVSGKWMVKSTDPLSKGKHFSTEAKAKKYLREQQEKVGYNYVIFDEGAVTITEKMFMPAEQAGAPKGRDVEAARLWEKKGVKSPYFKKWFGKSKVVDEEGNPQVVYKSMEGKTPHMEADDGGAGVTYVSQTWEGARQFAYDRPVREVFVKMETPFDFRNESHQNKLMTFLKKKGLESWNEELKRILGTDYEMNWGDIEYGLEYGLYQTMEMPTIRKWIRENGFDGFFLMEDEAGVTGQQSPNIAVFEPTQIKSATGNRGTFDPSDPNIMHMPAEQAGAPKGKNVEAARLWEKKGVKSPYFKKWSKNAPVVKIGETHEFTPEQPVVVEGVHGTTHSFDVVDPMRANPENDFGRGFYLSNSPKDVAVNYASAKGSDLTNRIELRSERLFDEMVDDPAAFNLKENLSEELIQEKARQMAVAELSGGAAQTYRVYARMDKPLVVGGRFKNESKFTYEFNEKTEVETGTLLDLVEAIKDEAGGEYFQLDTDRLVSDIFEASYDEIGAYDLVKTMKESEGLMYAENEMGNLVSGEFVKNVFREMGYDGIIDLTVDVKFGSKRKMGKQMEGVTSDTIHYVAFEPTQIKSATGAKGTFDPSNPNIMHMPAGKAGKGGQVTSQPRGGSAYFPKTTQRERKELQPR